MKLTPRLLFLFPLLAACSRQPQLEQRVLEIERRLALEQRVAEIETRLAQLEPSRKAPSPAGIPPKAVKPPTPSPLELVSWEYEGLKKDGANYRYALAFLLKNKGAKDIKLIEGVVSFTDLLGTELLRIRIDPDQRIPTGEFKRNVGEWNANDFRSEQMRMASMNKEDIGAVLVVGRVVYSDNTIGEFTP